MDSTSFANVFANMSMTTNNSSGNILEPPIPSKSTKPSQPPGSSLGNKPGSEFFDSVFPPTKSSAFAPTFVTPLDSQTTNASFEDAFGPLSRSPSPTKIASKGLNLVGASAETMPEVSQLVSMGFSSQDALAALEKYNFDLEKATNYLLK